MPGAISSSTNQEKGILRRGWITLFGAVAGAVLVFGNEILVARFLGVPLYGLYALALVVARIAETLSLFGLRSGVMHFLPIYLEQGRYAQVTGTILGAVLLPVGLGLLSTLIIWIGAPWIATDLLNQPGAMPYLRLFALPIPFMCLTEMLGVITRGYGRAELYVVIRNLTPPVSYLLLLGMLVLSGGDPLGVGRAFVRAQIIAALVGVAVVGRLVATRSRWESPRYSFGPLYRYSSPILLNTLLYTLMAASDVLMLGNMSGATEAGVYRACIQFRPAFDMATLAFSAAAIHLYPIFHRENDQQQLNRTYATVIRMTGAITASLFVLVLVSRRDLLGLLGPEFPQGATALALLLVGFLIQGSLGSSGILLVVTGHQTRETFAAFVGVIVNVGLNLWLIPPYGIDGAATATLVALLVLNLLRVFWVKRCLELTTLRTPLLRSWCLTGFVLGVVSLIASQLHLADGTGIWPMIFRSLLVVMLLALVFWLFGPRSDDGKVALDQ